MESDTEVPHRRRQDGSRNIAKLLVGMLGLNLEFLFAGFANPVVFAVDERVVVDAVSVVAGTQVALHGRIVSRL